MELVPILRQGDVLIISIMTALSDKDILHLQNRVLDKTCKSGVTGVVVDVSALDVIDSFSSKTIIDMAHAVRLLGAQTVVVGIQPEVALAMVLLGLTISDVPTALDLDLGIDLLKEGRPHAAE